MAIIDAIRRAPRHDVPDAIPASLQSALQRGRSQRDQDKAKRVLYRKFWEGDHYWFLTPTGQLNYQTAGMTGVVAGAKPGHRVRNTYNFVQALVEAKVSAATQQIPGYEITPSTDDPEDEAAASLASQVAIYGYDKWRIRRHVTKAVTDALVSREGFVMAYFDPNVGPYENGVGRGEIRLKNFSRDEVSWEDGEDFDDSRWHALEHQYRIETVEKLPGYIADVLSSEDKTKWGGVSPDKITVTEYLERPCREWPEGRRIFIAAGRPIVDYRLTQDGTDSEYWWEPYPCMDADGVVCDEPVLHRISYTVNPHGADLGLVERILDLQRTVNDTWNKILEIKNRALLLQVWLPKGSDAPKRDDTPGATLFYNAAIPGGKPEWEPAPDSGLIGQLSEIHSMAIEEMRTLAADVDIQPEARLAEGTAQLAQSSSAARWQSFLGDLAEFHSRLMRHCLTLVARHYDEQRQVDIRGQYGWQTISDFSRQDLRSQVNVRVLPGSLATKSRQAIQAEIQFVQANWPGAVSAEAALAVLHGGSSEGLIRSYENDKAKAWRVVKRVQAGGMEALASFPTRFDPTVPNPNFIGLDPTGAPLVNPETGKPESQMGADIPGWMPAPWDNTTIWRLVIGDTMKTLAFEKMDEGGQHALELVWKGIEDSEQQRAAAAAAQQQMQAESAGMSNAAAPQLPPPLPDRAGFNPGDNQSAVPTAA